MSEWITDRKPTREDAIPYCYEGLVWAHTKSGPRLYAWDQVETHPWQPIQLPQLYAKPKRWTVREFFGRYFVVASNDYDTVKGFGLPTREAAVRIAAIYEEVMP